MCTTQATHTHVYNTLISDNDTSLEEKLHAIEELKMTLTQDNEATRGVEAAKPLDFPPRPHVKRGEPLDAEALGEFRREDGSFENVQQLKQLISRGVR